MSYKACLLEETVEHKKKPKCNTKKTPKNVFKKP